MSLIENSQAFRFAEWSLWIVDASLPETEWRPDSIVEGAAPPVEAVVRSPDGRPCLRGKWVYVVQTAGENVLWHEFFVEREDSIRPVDMVASEGRERDERAQPGGPLRQVVLPSRIEGQVLWTYVLASRIRLPRQSVGELVDLCRAENLAPVDLGAPDSFVTHEGVPYLPATDPLTIAAGLHDQWRRARDGLLGYTQVCDGQPPRQQTATQNRLRKTFIAKVLTQTIDSGSRLGASLRNEFSAHGERRMRHFLRDYEQSVLFKTHRSEAAAAALAQWLNGSLLRFVERSHLVFEQEDFGAYFAATAAAVDRFEEEPQGRTVFARWLDDPGHWVHRFILPSGPAAPDVVDTVLENLSNFLTILKALAVTEATEGRTGSSARHVADAVGNATGRRLLEVENVSTRLAVAHSRELGSVRAEIGKLAPNRQEIRGIASENNLDAEHAFTSLEGMAAAVNLALAVAAITEWLRSGGRRGASWIDAVSAIGSSVQLVDCLRLTLQAGARDLPWVGLVVAIFDAVQSSNHAGEAEHAASRGDTDVAMAQGIALLAPAVSAFGWFALAVAPGLFEGGSVAVAVLNAAVVSAATGLVAVAAVLALAAGIYALLMADNDMEVFVRHCLWGERDRGDDLQTQHESLLRMMAAFTVQGGDGGHSVLISAGFLRPGSRFHVRFRQESGGGVHGDESYYIIDCGHLDEMAFETRRGGPGRVSTYLAPGSAPMIEMTEQHLAIRNEESGAMRLVCDVLLDLEGDGQFMLPRSGHGVHVIVDDGGPTRERVSSRSADGRVGPDER